MALDNPKRNVFFIVLDTGGMRQVIVEDHSSLDFEQWQRDVIRGLTIEGGYRATVVSAGEPAIERLSIVTLPAGGMVAFFTGEDIKRKMKRAEISQPVIHGVR